MVKPGSVAVTVVTYNSGRFIRRCLESVLEQKYQNKEIIVIDNASVDGTTDILEHFEGRVRIVYNEENIGFAAAQNQAIALANSEWVLTLNPDVLLLPGFLRSLVMAGEADASIGTVCGKLLAISSNFALPDKPVIDSTGIYFTPTLRHLDRGSRKADNGSYRDFEYVFGATAAAALYRRTMIEDVSISGEFFDDDFFVYREDADVAWRAQLLGWKCVYTPMARGYHVRNVLPGKRRALPAEINMHSVKNRFMMRTKNITFDVYRRNWIPITLRDIVVFAACLTHEFSSLRAFPAIARSRRRLLAKRREIMLRRRVDNAYMARWFAFKPVSFPAPDVAERVLSREKVPSR